MSLLVMRSVTGRKKKPWLSQLYQSLPYKLLDGQIFIHFRNTCSQQPKTIDWGPGTCFQHPVLHEGPPAEASTSNGLRVGDSQHTTRSHFKTNIEYA